MEQQTRPVGRVIRPIQVSEGAGVRLQRSIATAELDHHDPFLLFDHFGSENPDDYIAGFPMHPHRGIETVTYILKGEVTHRDSLGNEGTIGAGDVQWMTAGRGIMHEEMPLAAENGMEGFQLWVNLPADLKMTEPRYQDISSQEIPVVEQEGGVIIRVIAGEVDGVSGPVTEIFADPSYLDISVPAGSSFSCPVKKGQNVFAYLFEGQGSFGDDAESGTPARTQAGTTAGTVESPGLIIFEDGDIITARASERSARFLLVSGSPIGEPIARYGPFVMNTREEIEATIREIREGTFIR